MRYLENWFYDNYMILNSHKCEFTSFIKSERIKKGGGRRRNKEKFNGNEVFTCHKI